MLDIKFIRENPKVVKDSIKKRGVKVDIDKLLEIDKKRVKLISEIDALRAQKKPSQKPTTKEIMAFKKIKAQTEQKEKELEKILGEFNEILETIPNLISPDTPIGQGEEKNKEIKKWGKPPKFDFEAKDHISLGEKLDLIDFDRGAKVAGTKFYYLKNEAALLEFALVQYAFNILTKRGFIAMVPPNLVTERVSKGTGFLPKGEEKQIYKIENEDLYLIATAEVPLTAYHIDEILRQADLPLRYVGFSPCYRVEAGAYGKYSKGLYRVHQFDKAEIYIFTLPADSDKAFDEIIQIQEDIYQGLEIPYRVTLTCSGELSAAAYKKADLEYWSPAENTYREITSASNCTDFQARRLNIRFRDGEGKIHFCHTLNGTAIAISRTLVAIFENYQNYDGSISIPKILQPYLGGMKIIKR